MKLIVGLGNPGAKYAGNRHNIGFMAIDRIAGDHAIGPFRARFQGEMAEGRLGSSRVALLKPMGFMNLSGQAVGEAMRYLKLGADDVIVIHDELDLASGRARFKTGGGHAGHNGLRSIHQHIGADYHRVRLGIGHPGDKARVAAYVLSDFAKAEAEVIEDVLRGVSDGAEALAAGDGGRFQNAVAQRVAPARNSGAARGGDAKGGAQPSKPAKSPGQAPETPNAKPEAPASFTDRLRSLADRFR